MGVPEEIRRVPRPSNTVVVDNGTEGVKRYAVRARSGVRYVPGGNPQPVNGSVIGYIADGRFVPISEPAGYEPQELSYGSMALIKSVSRDILDDLLDVYGMDIGYGIMAVAALRVAIPHVTDKRLSTHYKRTFASIFYPGVAISRNSVCTLHQMVGMNGPKRKEFYTKRIQAVSEEHHIAIDGTLKTDNSSVNDLSDFSYKSRVRGTKDVSVIYAYDVERMEPICAQVFPGNCTDASAYAEFIRENDISKGIIVADKGFPPSRIREELGRRPQLHFLTPIKRNDIRIVNNGMLDFEEVLKNTEHNVMCKKRCIQGGMYLYAFRDPYKASLEEMTYLGRKSTQKAFDFGKYSKKDRNFGTIVFESDLDMDCETAYRCYDDRWLLEMVFNYYKNDEFLDSTRVQGDFSVYGSEFINSIATMITCRIIRRFTETKLLEDASYREVMDDLSSAWRKIDAPVPPSRTDGAWVHTLPNVHETMEKLGLSEGPVLPEPKKRGRPRKQATQDRPKRPRGRPRKNPVS